MAKIVSKVIEFWCIKCETKRSIDFGVISFGEFKNKRKTARAICPVCQTKVFKILSVSDLKLI